jgi:hypothetical protein
MIENDQKWAKLNSRLIESMKISDWKTMSLIYLEEATILKEEKKDIYTVMREAQLCELMFEKSLGISEVEILVSVTKGKGCLQSESIKGHKMAIDEAIKLMPVPIKCNDAGCSCITGYVIQLPRNIDYSAKVSEFTKEAFSNLEDTNHYYFNMQKAKAYELFNYIITGVQKVEILSARDEQTCPKCQVLNGKIFSVQEAFKEMPIPAFNCDNDLGYCRCVYLPVIL